MDSKFFYIMVIAILSVTLGTSYAVTQLDTEGGDVRQLVTIGDGATPQTVTDGTQQDGLVAVPKFSPTISTTDVNAMNFFTQYDPGSGVVIQNARGLWIRGVESGAGSVTNGYGIYVDLAAGGYGTNKYPGVFLGGNVGIGTATPPQKLSIIGPDRQLVSIGDGATAQTVTDGNQQDGLVATPRFSPTISTTDVNAMNFFTVFDPGSGVTIDNARGLWIRGVQLGAGSITNGYGIYADLTGGYGTNKYPGVFLGGNVGIGTATPVQALDVVGNMQITGDIKTVGDICIGLCP